MTAKSKNPLLSSAASPSRGGKAKSGASRTATSGSKKPGKWRRAFNGLWLAVNVLAGICLIVCALGGTVSPQSCPYGVLVAMAFPGALIAVTVLFVLDLIWWRRTAVVAGGCMLVCVGAIRDFCPLNLPKRAMTPEQKELSFTLMNYNTMAFDVQPEVNCEVNPQISYILQQEPDVVCVQEYFLMMKNKNTKIIQAQIDSLYSRYPHVVANSYFQIVFSKFPVEPIPLDFVNEEGKGDMAAWRLQIHGEVVNLFTVHLRSLYFTQKDKAEFSKMFHPDDINRSSLSILKHGILEKIVNASRVREQQLDDLKRYIKKYGGETAIVCGDFNEPQGCWGLHTLEADCHLRQVYPEVGFGPMITYNANHFWVRIDHVLYRGRLAPRSIKRGNLRASDHYPLTTTFCIKEP